jgi:hypothetical protein
MAACLEPHRDDSVAAMSLEPLRFPHGGSRAHYRRPRRFDTLEQIMSRKAEMKANDLRLELFNDRARFGVKGFARGQGKRSVRI